MDDKKAQGLDHLMPVGSPLNQQLLALYDEFYLTLQNAGLPFPPLLYVFSHTLLDNDALGKPFDPEKLTGRPYDTSYVEAAAKDVIQNTSQHLQQQMQNAGITFDNLKYSKNVLNEIGSAFESAPYVQHINELLDRFFGWCNANSGRLGYPPIDNKVMAQIKQQFIAGIATNVAHAIEKQIGKIHPAGRFMLKALPVIAENNPTKLTDRVIEAVVEGTKFPTNMAQFGQYFSKDFPLNKNKDGADIKDEKGFVNAVKNALTNLEVNPHFLMMDKDDQQKQINIFLGSLNFHKPQITPNAKKEIADFAQLIGQRKGYITRHLGGHTGIVNALEKVSLNGKQVIKQLEAYLAGLKKHASVLGMDSRIEYLEAFLKQLKDTQSQPFWFVELMHYDRPEFKDSPVGHLFRNEKIKKDLPIVEMLEGLRKGSEGYVVDNMKLDEMGKINYLQYLKREYVTRPPNYSWNIKTTLKDLFVTRKENVVDSRLNKEQLAARIETYVASEAFGKALKKIPAWNDFAADLVARFSALKKAADEKGVDKAFTRGEGGYEYQLFLKMKEFMEGIRDYSKDNIFHFQNIMLIENLDGALDVLKDSGGLSNIIESGSDGEIFRLFDKLFPRTGDELLKLLPEDKKFGLQVKEGSDVLWRKAREAMIGHIATIFPEQNKEAVTTAINHLLDPRNVVEPDAQWSPPAKASKNAQKAPAKTFNFQGAAMKAEERLAKEIDVIINRTNFKNDLVLKKPELYGDFIRKCLYSITPTNPDGEIARIQKTKNPSELFLVVMSEDFKKEFLIEVSSKITDTKKQQEIVERFTKFRDFCAKHIEEEIGRPVNAKQISDVIKILNPVQAKVQATSAPTMSAKPAAPTAWKAASKQKLTPNLTAPSSTATTISSASSSASSSSKNDQDKPQTRPRAFGRGSG